jgi:hypothetical protein
MELAVRERRVNFRRAGDLVRDDVAATDEMMKSKHLARGGWSAESNQLIARVPRPCCP